MTRLYVLCCLFLISCGTIEYSSDVLDVSIKSPSVSADRGQLFVSVKCDGSWTLALEADGADDVWAELSQYSGKGNKNSVVLSYNANDTGSTRILKIVLSSRAGSAECSLTQSSSDTLAPVPSVPPSDGGEKEVGWLELPAMDDPELEYYSHSFEMGGETYRNFTFGYSKKDYLALWVAYPLCKMYTNGSAGKSDWIPNPLLSEEYQPDFHKSFGFTQGYERGHQIANADRKCCEQANQQTYYYTNATLQHKDFNGAIWATLEGNLRNAANKSDTLYVVTGCVLSDNPKTITDYDGHVVPIPEGYFKAAIRYSKAATRGTWLGAAFYLDHKKYSYNYITEAEAMSIDALEEMTGMDFFVNLVDKIGAGEAADVEAQNPISYKSEWGIY